MRTKYIIVLGSLLSGLGKGIVTASVSKMLSLHGYRTLPVKFDGYLNYDCGTMNPYRHGEVFVLDDKSEVDMDFGTYERFLDIQATGEMSITGGKLFGEIIKQERNGNFLGRDVQMIPHLTDLIIKKIEGISKRNRLDFLVIEVGGTVGDIENSYFIEAMRQLSLKESAMFINVTYLPTLEAVGEQKTKPTQIANRNLMQIGIKPDVLICRADSGLTKSVREKLAMFSNLPVENIIEDLDVPNVYDMPGVFMKQGLDNIILNRFGLRTDAASRKRVGEWNAYTSPVRVKGKTIISVVGKYVNLHDSYASVIAALEHSGRFIGVDLDIKWVESERLEGVSDIDSVLGASSGIIVPGGFGSRGIDGIVRAIQYARENNKAYLGLCLGMQLMAIEYARNVCGMAGANSSEFDENTKYKIVDLMESQRDIKQKGGTMRLGSWPLHVRRGTAAWKAYGKEKIEERHRHRYEFNNRFRDRLERHGLVISGTTTDDRIVEIVEWGNGIGIGTQAHPEFKSRPGRPAPLFREFVRLSTEIRENSLSRHDT